MTSEPRVAAIVLAAGSGARFGEPKQFLELLPGRRLVDVAVATLGDVVDWLTVILPADRRWDGPPVDAAVAGGDSRLDSVRRGLAALPDSIEIVVIGDAAHPLASAASARAAIAALDDPAVDAAVPWLEAVDVLKERSADGALRTVGRDGIGTAQVPVAFRLETLRRVHVGVVDGWEDTQLIERAGGRVVAVAGDPRNVHVVDAASLEVARALAAHSGSSSGARTPS